jgi:hypothetical protein
VDVDERLHQVVGHLGDGAGGQQRVEPALGVGDVEQVHHPVLGYRGQVGGHARGVRVDDDHAGVGIGGGGARQHRRLARTDLADESQVARQV